MKNFVKGALILSGVIALGTAVASVGHVHYSVAQLKQLSGSFFNFHVANNSQTQVNATVNGLNLPAFISPNGSQNTQYPLPSAVVINSQTVYVSSDAASTNQCSLTMDYDPSVGMDLYNAPNNKTCSLQQGKMGAMLNINLTPGS